MTPDFTLRLKRPLVLRGRRVMRTLSDAVGLMGDLPEFPDLGPRWQLACEAVSRAARTRNPVDIEFATCELELVLGEDGLLDRRVEVWLPRALGSGGSAPRVLVASADAQSCRLIRACVGGGACGDPTSVATTAAGAVSLLRARRPDIAFIDMRLPGATTRLAPAVAEASVPVVFMTGSKRGARILERLGWRHLVKPLSADMVIVEMLRCSAIARG